MDLEETTEAITLAGAGYCLRIDRGAPLAELWLNGRLVTILHLGSGLDTVATQDDQTTLGRPTLSREADRCRVTWEGHSTCWARKQLTLSAWATGFAYRYRVEGRGTIDRAHFFPHARRCFASPCCPPVRPGA